jgi:hypothetical protein
MEREAATLRIGLQLGLDEYALAKQGSYGTEEGVFRALLAHASRFEDAR